MSEDTKPLSLDQIKARREEIRKAREVRDAEDVLASERRALDEDEAVFRLEAVHGPLGKGLAMVRCGEGGPLLIGKKPHAATYNKFQDVKDPDTKALRAFVQPCLVYPENATALLDEFPAALARLGVELGKLCGLDPKA